MLTNRQRVYYIIIRSTAVSLRLKNVNTKVRFIVSTRTVREIVDIDFRINALFGQFLLAIGTKLKRLEASGILEGANFYICIIFHILFNCPSLIYERSILFSNSPSTVTLFPTQNFKLFSRHYLLCCDDRGYQIKKKLSFL